MDVSELEASATVDAELQAEDEYEGQEELLVRQDILDAIILLKKVMHMLNYVSNTELCKTVSKRERTVMETVAIEVGEFLDEVEPNYDPEDGD